MNCYHSAVINASIDEVWSVVSNFHEINYAPEVISSVTSVGGTSGTKAGAKRILNDAFHETLLSIDQSSYLFSYSIDDGPGVVSKDAVSNYVGTVKLHPITVGGDTCIEWASDYESEDPEAVADFCNPIYNALLVSLKNHFA
jgi:hypothetical protein